MQAGRFFVASLSFALLALPASAADEPAPPLAASTQPAEAPPAPAPPADNAAQATPTAAAPAAQTGLAPELAERLVVGGDTRAVDRQDREALARFYAGRQHEPVWVSAAGFTPAAQAAMAEIRRADDWGLEASAFRPSPSYACARNTHAW
jgi:hypothetical protein